MSIVIKKRAKFNKKKLLQRIAILSFIYFFSFFMLYAFFGGGEEVLEVTDGSAEEVVYENEGDKALAEGKYPETIQYFQKVLDENDEDFFAMNRIGQAYYKIGEIDKGKYYLFKSKELAPKYIDTYKKLANIYFEQGDLVSAENIIDSIPTENPPSFISKGKLLVQLASLESSLEDRIIHLTRAVSYFKKYNTELYDNTITLLIDAYFQLAEHYKSQGDRENALTVFKNITKYKKDCTTVNKMALSFRDVNDEMVVRYAQRAVQIAKSQDERRLTKETLINLKHYFEKKGDYSSLTLLSSFILALNESTILVDEKFSPFAIVDDKFDFVFKKDSLFPEVTFKVKNQTDTMYSYLEARVTIYLTPERILDTENVQIVFRDVPLRPHQTYEETTIQFDKSVNPRKYKNYTVSLSLSANGKDWQLYRLYSKKEEKVENKSSK